MGAVSWFVDQIDAWTAVTRVPHPCMQSGLPAPPGDRENRVPLVELLIVDDSATVRDAVRRAANEASEFIEVVGEAADAGQAIDLCERLRPDVVLLDVDMPGMSGINVLPALRNWVPGMKVAVLSADAATEAPARAAGADAFFAKADVAPSELVERLRALAVGNPAGALVAQPTGPTHVDLREPRRQRARAVHVSAGPRRGRR